MRADAREITTGAAAGLRFRGGASFVGTADAAARLTEIFTRISFQRLTKTQS